MNSISVDVLEKDIEGVNIYVVVVFFRKKFGCYVDWGFYYRFGYYSFWFVEFKVCNFIMVMSI